MPKQFKNLIFTNRQVYMSLEKPQPAASADQKKVEEVAKAALDKARLESKGAAIEKGKTEAKQAIVVPPQIDQKKYPEIPLKLSGLKFDSKDSKSNPAQGTIEQPFKFGDYNIKGKIILPEKPIPGAKTTYVFNYVDNPEKFDHGKFLDELKKQQGTLGNTIVVTLKTPEGETRIDKEKVNTMSALMKDMERFQTDLKKDPKFTKIDIARAETVLHVTSQGEKTKFQSLMGKYLAAKDQKDPRITKVPLLNNSPEDFSRDLESAVAVLNGPTPEKPGDNPKDPSAGEGKATKPTSSGGSAGGFSGGASGTGGGGKSAIASTTTGESASTATPPATGASSESPSGVEKEIKLQDQLEGPIKGFTGFFGDSITVGHERSHHFNEKMFDSGKAAYFKALGAQNSKWLLNELKNVPNEVLKEMKNAVVLIGTNDIGNTGPDFSAEKIIERIKTIHQFFLDRGITVYACTIPPFKGHGFSTYKSDYVNVNAKREQINAAIMSDSRLKKIPLHLSEKDGGIGDNEDPQKIGEKYLVKYGSTVDYVHPKPKEFAQLIEKYLKSDQQQSGADQATTTPTKSPEKPGKLIPYDEKTDSYYKWAASIDSQFIKEGASYGTYKVVEYNGKKLLAKFTQHDKQAATGKIGKYDAVEIFEYNDKVELEQKKKHEKPSLAARLEKISLGNGVEMLLDKPADYNPSLPTEVIVHATPNGSTAETAYGVNNQIGRQTDLIRKSSLGRNIVVALISPQGLKWPNYLRSNPGSAGKIIDSVMDNVSQRLNDPTQLSYSLDSHSGGGSFAFASMNAKGEIPSMIHQLNFFDSIYAYDGPRHAQMIKRWLESDSQNILTLVTGSPEIMSKQQELVNDLEKLGVKLEQVHTDQGVYTEYQGMEGRIKIKVLKRFDHNGTITRNGFAMVHASEQYDLVA